MLLSFLLTILVIYLPGINSIFELSALSANNLLIAITLALAIIPIVEIVKLFTHLFGDSKQ
jgi:Ca2+-transporting ATPase